MQDVITINNYAEFEQKFDNVMQETAGKFVVIGYMLKVARDTDILRESGYSTMGEFAQKRYGLTKDIASRYIAINDRYSEGGYSEQLDPKYKSFGYTKLAEMLTLPDAIVEEIKPEMTKNEIRAIKEEVREEGAVSDIEVMLEERDEGVEIIETLLGKVFYQIGHEHPEIFNRLWVAVNEQTPREEYLLDALAPSGTAMISCRIPGMGRFMLSVAEGENLQVINVRSGEKEEFTLEYFKQIAVQFLQSTEQDWKETYKNIYNEELPEEKPEVAPAQPKTERVVKSAKPKKPEIPKETLKQPEKAEPEEQLPGQMEVADYPELMPKAALVAVQEENLEEHAELKAEAVEVNDEIPTEQVKSTKIEENEPSETYEEVRTAAREGIDAVDAVFWGWEDESVIPKGELEMALKNAKNLVAVIEKLIEMTGE